VASSIEDGGDASAWPSICKVDDSLVEGKGRMQTRRKAVTQEAYPQGPAGRSGPIGPDGRGVRGRSPRFTWSIWLK